MQDLFFCLCSVIRQSLDAVLNRDSTLTKHKWIWYGVGETLRSNLEACVAVYKTVKLDTLGKYTRNDEDHANPFSGLRPRRVVVSVIPPFSFGIKL